MKGSVTGKVVEWSKGETMDQMVDTFSAWDYTIFALLLVISTGLSLIESSLRFRKTVA